MLELPRTSARASSAARATGMQCYWCTATATSAASATRASSATSRLTGCTCSTSSSGSSGRKQLGLWRLLSANEVFRFHAHYIT